ncbi:MAG: phage antirepressor KilAC domain-containing protein [Comamonas sp.]|uniref:phage antirepressor KilAC domain-containing protein n=1 Tax=Comamonas sp. TaxID=34028 RepID=UPI002649D692|nr:phage antirepressor KilAC domain-containing protein [Comamonas sp.]MDN5503442.1 phage antirepressor KilAC domain-containing protein [Comamonas sp.]MDN5538900.1 phage antirepressor KilAC domain-containing protein [Comamonas sp.]
MSSIVINNTSLQVIEYMGKRVVTLAQVDSVHGRPEGTAGRNFREHKHRLIEGEDYFKVGADEFRRHLDPNHSKFASEDVILLAEPGYLMLVKSFTDDLAWQVQRQLTNNYFRRQSQAPAIDSHEGALLALQQLTTQQLALIQENKRTAAELAQAAPKAEYVDRYVAANGSMGFRQVAKLLTAKEPEFRAFLEDSKILYRLAGVLTPYQNHIEAGRFSIKTGVSQVSEHAFAHARFTPKGVQWIAGLWSQHQVRMKQSGEVTA